jgi:hypothetical protein
VLDGTGEALNPGCCTGRSGGIELTLGGVDSCLGPFRTLAVGVGKDSIEAAVGPIGAAPGSGRLLTFGFCMTTLPSSVAVMLARLLGRSGLGRES